MATQCRPGPRHGRRFRLVRLGAADDRAPGVRARTVRIRSPRLDAARPLHAGARRRQPSGHGNDQVVRHQLPLSGTGMELGHALRRRRGVAVRGGQAGQGTRPLCQGGPDRAAHSVACGQDQVRPFFEARSAAAHGASVPAPARPSQGTGSRLGADGRAGIGARSGRALARCLPADLRGSRTRIAEDSARDLLRVGGGARNPAQVAAGFRRPSGPRARAAAACDVPERLPGVESAVARGRRRPQYLANRPRPGSGRPQTGPRAARRSAVGFGQLLAAPRSGRPRPRKGASPRNPRLAGVRRAKAR